MKKQSQTPAAKKSFVLFIALFRLALLLGPEALAMKLLGRSPVICAVGCLAILAVWFSVDVWPFRAAPTAAPATAKRREPHFAQNLTKGPWWSYLFCRIIVFFALFHSKLSI